VLLWSNYPYYPLLCLRQYLPLPNSRNNVINNEIMDRCQWAPVCLLTGAHTSATPNGHVAPAGRLVASRLALPKLIQCLLRALKIII